MNCKELIHPFQNDPGVSRRHRIMEDLLSGTALVDGRSVADLLDYFVQLSKNINYYNKDVTVSDWQLFFKDSLPFALTEIIKLDRNKLSAKIDLYNNLLSKKPAKASLQLLIQYIYNNLILTVNNWQKKFAGSNLPTELRLNKIIKDKLVMPLKDFIVYANAAQKWFYIKGLNFNPLLDEQIWELDITDVYANLSDAVFQASGNTKRKRLFALRDKLLNIVPAFSDAIRVLANTAPADIEQSFFPLKEELKKNHPPHLALLFAFIKLFGHLQDDLNSFTKKHLDFFYKDVLKLKAHGAVPDNVHLVFEIQARLDKYLLKKGLLFKDGKDNNKAEVLFATDDEIVINKAQIADQRTLFLNNRSYGGDSMYVEGVYMAPDATKADGIDKEFKDEDQPASRPTLGAQYSKYADPENKFIKPYPNARLGFMLASPVLLLNEGNRTVTITLDCELRDNYCSELNPETGKSNPCCDDATGIGNANAKPATLRYDDLAGTAQQNFLTEISEKLNHSFYYINRELIAAAVKKGVSKELLEKLNGFLIKKPAEKLCYCPVEEKLYEITLPAITFINNKPVNLFTDDEMLVIGDIFQQQKLLTVAFSGEKEWIIPYTDKNISDKFLEISITPSAGGAVIKITARLQPDQKAITFYNAEKLKEDFNTTLPLVKIELNDKIKLTAPDKGDMDENCCRRNSEFDNSNVSLYHFFRNLKVKNTSKIDVKVCGVKNLIVQNNENVENINGPIRVFGVRPKVGADFYIGSKEIFIKKWNEIWVNAEWKDRPQDFKDFYKHYTYELFEDGSGEITNDSFKLNISLLENGKWRADGSGNLFTNPKLTRADHCNTPPVPVEWYQDVYNIKSTMFVPGYVPLVFDATPVLPYNINSRYNFLKLTLGGVSFQHDRYTFVLTRHMMALSAMVDPISMKFARDYTVESQKITAAIISLIAAMHASLILINQNNADVISEIQTPATGVQKLLNDLLTKLNSAFSKLPAADPNGAKTDVNNAIGIRNSINAKITTILNKCLAIAGDVSSMSHMFNDDPGGTLNADNLAGIGLIRLANELKTRLDKINALLQVNNDLKTGLPHEPYTPALKTLYIDYTATADVNDISLIHLYPYTGTYKSEDITASPALLPTFCDEGNLFIGLKDLQPGSNVNMLFQLAEATADSESVKEELQWFYLENNAWKILRPGFEVLNDDTDGLTSSGIIKFALPANMTNENTILPKGLHWIKAAVAKNSRTVSETMSVFTQAIKAVFTNDAANDPLRLASPLSAGAVAKLQEADSSVRKITQPFDTFGGMVPEGEGHFYVRASELLRHKGRAIQKFDYERLVLEAFPQIFKVKCINHSFWLDAHKYTNDIPLAPGYVLLAVIPDLNQLKAARQFEPKVPAGMIDNIQDYIRQRTSPFVRFKVLNPRYEKVDFCLRVNLYQGKDESYYKEKLKQDLREFLAPWAVGVYDKLSFGQCINQSDIVQFLERLDYLDYITELKMRHEDDDNYFKPEEQYKVCPISPRSVLIAGDIDVCIQQSDCEKWDEQAAPCANKAEMTESICNEP